MKLYRTEDRENTLNKTLTNELDIDVVLRNDIDILNPIIILEGDFMDYNYAHIPELRRYYFVDSISTLNGNRVALSCTCDVLGTYKDDIINSKARLKRRIRHGEYIRISTDSDAVESVEIVEGNQTLGQEDTIVLSTIGR